MLGDVLDAAETDRHCARVPTALPRARGPITEQLLTAFRRPRHRVASRLRSVPDTEDLQLALYCCYELHYQGLPGVDDDWEWEPSVLELRSQLEGIFEAQLRDRSQCL